MNEGREGSLQVRHFFREAKIPLEIRPVLGRMGFSKAIATTGSLKGTQSVGIWGKREIQQIERLAFRQRKTFVQEKFDDLTCLILTDGISFPRVVKQKAKEMRVALFTTRLPNSKCKTRLKKLFSFVGSPQDTVSGGLLNIFGRGVLILGDSGVGKSESALELISRGHLFVSDDVVQIKKDLDGNLVGSAPPLSRDFMEIRGLGIINIKRIFGNKSICGQTKIDLIIMLKRWKEGKEYDRLGLKFPESQNILGVDIPKISIPVALGRNMATLIEVACKVFILKQKGYHAAGEITKKLDRALAIR